MRADNFQLEILTMFKIIPQNKKQILNELITHFENDDDKTLVVKTINRHILNPKEDWEFQMITFLFGGIENWKAQNVS